MEREKEMNGIHEEMNAYHASAAIGSSQAKQAKKSIRLFKDYLEGIASFTTTPAMALGTAIHAALLEPDTFADAVIVSPYDSFRSAEAKAWKIEKEAAGVCIVKQDYLNQIEMICQRTTAIDEVADILENTEKELVYRAEINGLQCQCRFDAIDTDCRIAYDVKTTAKFDKFDWQVRDLGYDFSAGWYDAVFYAATGGFLKAWNWLVVETVAPFRCQIVEFYELGDANRDARDVAAKISMSMKLDEWTDETQLHRVYGTR